ncbi:MAG: UDP-N-acetylmuramyl-tripeptide synthetase, partial [Planctomycetota bacterium]
MTVAASATLLSRYEPKHPQEAHLMKLEKLIAAAFPGQSPGLPETTPVTVVTADSRKVRPGAVFVAIPGTAVDGVRYVPEAVEKGAIAIVAERRVDVPEGVTALTVPDARAAIADLAAAFYRHPAREMTIAGITGTNGKTSTALLLRSILEAAGNRTALFGTITYDVGDRRVPAPTTTPDPVSLMGYLREALDLGIRHAVMEMSSHALVQQRARGIEPAVGIFTNLAPEHLDYHRDFADYRAAKALLFQDLAPDATAVLNGEDPASNHFAARTRARVLRYGTNEAATVRAFDIESGPRGISFTLTLPDGSSALIRSPLLGRINVMNSLAAAAAAHALGAGIGIGIEEIRAGLENQRDALNRHDRLDAWTSARIIVSHVTEGARVAREHGLPSPIIDNIYMHHVVTESGERLFPAGMKLLSHWNLRDEIKANYSSGDEAGLERQRTVQKVMERIVDQTIPEIAINNPHVDWNPYTNEVSAATVSDVDEPAPANLAVSNAPEPNTRYEVLLGTYRAARQVDPYSPTAPTHIDRSFIENREIPEERVVAMFEAVLSSKMLERTGRLIEARLGRPLEPFDIWYTGFRARGTYSEADLDAITRKRYPTAAAYEADMPKLLVGL